MSMAPVGMSTDFRGTKKNSRNFKNGNEVKETEIDVLLCKNVKVKKQTVMGELKACDKKN